jgi:hypothetical protein
MATKFLTNLNLTQNQILNGTFEKVGTDPETDLFEGRLIYNTTEDTIKVYSGSAWRKMIHGVTAGGSYTDALTVSESNGAVTLTLNLADADSAGLLSSTFYSLLNAATATNTGSTLAKRDADGRLQVTAPSADLDAANKAYVDAARSGLDVKQSAKLATNEALPTFTHSGGVLTASANGALSVDSAVVALTDRILVKNETSTNAPFNGLYEVTDTGDAGTPWELTRTTDADASVEVTSGMFVFVEQGTAWSDSGWVLTTDGTIILGTTNLTFVQFSSAGQSIAGNGLTKTGNTIDVVGTTDRITSNADSIDIAATYAGQSSITTLGTIATGTWEATDVAVAHGGTGASTTGDARTNLATGGTQGAGVSVPVLSRTVALTIGDGSNTSYGVQHGLGTRDVIVQVYDTGGSPTYETVIVDVVRTDTNNVTVSFSSIIASNSYRVVVTG